MIADMRRLIRSHLDAHAAAGAYILCLRLESPTRVAYGSRMALLSAGDYFYCGSARGPGGLKGRIRRHLSKQKRAHWHVDQLTAVATTIGAIIEEAGDECALNHALEPLPMPAPGFGSSDCPNCISHLRYLHPDARPPEWLGRTGWRRV